MDHEDLCIYSGGFEVQDGPCTVTKSGQCVGRPDGYSSHESCTIAVDGTGQLGPCSMFETGKPGYHECGAWLSATQAIILPIMCIEELSGPLVVVLSNAEAGYDHLVIDDVEFDGENCPLGVGVDMNTVITWVSDGSVQGDGWEVCIGGAAGAGHR